MLTLRSDVLKRHIRSHTAQEGDNEDDEGDDDNDNDCDDPRRASPVRRRSTSPSSQRNGAPASHLSESVQSLAAADGASFLSSETLHPDLPAATLVSAVPDLHGSLFPASLDVSCLRMDLDGRLFPSILSPNTAWPSTLGPAMPSPPGFATPWDAFFLSMGSPVPPDAMSILSRKHSLGSDIPDERFTKLARLWPKKREPRWSLIQTLWSDAAGCKATNLFSESSPQNTDNDNENDGQASLPTNGHHGDLDDARRLSLIQFMLPNLGTVRLFSSPSLPCPLQPPANQSAPCRRETTSAHVTRVSPRSTHLPCA